VPHCVRCPEMNGASTGAGLRLHGLHKSYGALTVTDNLSFELAAGGALGIIGPNGAGKSTLFNLLTGVVRSDAGRIVFAGRDITRLDASARARLGICRAHQVPQPFVRMSVFENLLVAASFAAGLNTRAARAHCIEILEQTGLMQYADAPAGNLRLLDRKRLELARALAARPRLLLLDEIAGGLTDAECSELVAIVREVHASGVAVIWIEHVLHVLVSFAPRLLVLDFGARLADGPTHEVMGNPDVQRIYMGIQT